jgi:DHA1 family inner membrane transport protein
MAVAAGYGWVSTGLVGCSLALGGFVIWAVSVLTSRKKDRPVEESCALRMTTH